MRCLAPGIGSTSRTDRAKQSANSAIRLLTLRCWLSDKPEPIETCLRTSATRRGLCGSVTLVYSDWLPPTSTSGCKSSCSPAVLLTSCTVQIESHHPWVCCGCFWTSCFCLLHARRPGRCFALLGCVFVAVSTSDSSLVCLSTHFTLSINNNKTCLEGELSSPFKTFALFPVKFVFAHALIMVDHFPFTGILRVSFP